MTNGLRILGIDDQREILDVVQFALELTTDWSFMSVTSGAAALADHCEARYDAALLDLTIPGEDPAATIAALRKQHVAQTVILLTGADVSDARRRELGADHVLEKPFDPMALATQIEAALNA